MNKSQGYHSGSQWAAKNWKLPPAVSHLVIYRLVNGGFHVPGPRVAVSGSHGSLSSSGWTSSLTGPMLPLNRTPAALTFLQVVAHAVVSDSLRPYGLCSPPGSSIHGIFQARILEWVVISFSIFILIYPILSNKICLMV